jgi:hypothetical protein
MAGVTFDQKTYKILGRFKKMIWIYVVTCYQIFYKILVSFYASRYKEKSSTRTFVDPSTHPGAPSYTQGLGCSQTPDLSPCAW